MQQISPLVASALAVVICMLNSVAARAQVIVTPTAGNQLTVSAAVTVSYSAGLYTYAYTFTNASSSAQRAWFITVELAGDAASTVTNVQAPRGWSSLPAGPSPTVAWAATEIDTIPAGFVDDGSVVPSPYQIAPGQSLAGFSFQSPSPPKAVRFFAQGFTPVPQAVDAADLAAAGYSIHDYTSNSIIGVTQGPVSTSTSAQPSADGFFFFVGLTNGSVIKPPVSVGIQFNAANASVDEKSLHVILNGTDITGSFVQSGETLTATLGSSALSLQNGVNVLKGVMSGMTNGQAQPIYDMNEIRFYVNSDRPLDLNGDGVINCLDLAIVKASFGKSTGESGFDPRADVNGDGVVNILDLSAVARAISTEARCP